MLHFVTGRTLAVSPYYREVTLYLSKIPALIIVAVQLYNNTCHLSSSLYNYTAIPVIDYCVCTSVQQYLSLIIVAVQLAAYSLQ